MTRPSQVLLIVVVYWLGVAIALARGGSFDAVAVAAGAGATVATAVTVHYANEYADYDTDRRTERTPFSGGSGALVDLDVPDPRRFAWRATVVSGVVAVAAVLAVGAVGVSLATQASLLAVFGLGWAYSLPPVRLIARGVGEATNVLLGALVLPLAGYATVASPDAVAVLALAPFAWLVVPNLLATHYADREADAATGKRTLAVRLSVSQVRRLGVVFAAGYPVLVAVVSLVGLFPSVVVVAHVLAVLPAAWTARTLTRRRSPLPAVAAMVTLAATTSLAWTWTWLAHA
ncbi:prenyltransferase [Halobaculum gomorrense]|uniref:1,4-dihydroxy-2-naphthoate octaprenyltransferase n=1 Tax=Halobaculum gomorrense TaxID=43928 RepID=A0A1M5N1K1_9EURY|nr:prenyltransferase [Halobaculum gomorrense]SHG83446.1 1,4-dihydroxy-2-naphthoate octaprenyltransferase [Halobaculum gomorrense]